ncbi:hypothetical protein [Bacillus cereus]|nr:hypothetical protein [Bacillus cereus]
MKKQLSDSYALASFQMHFAIATKQGWKIPKSDFAHIKQEIRFVKEDY